jgi:hypothetical protein
MAAARPSTSTRWVTGIMVVALLASVLVVVGLIQITGESPSSAGGTGGSESAAPATGSPSDSASADPASTSPAAAPSGTRSGATAPSTTPVELAGSGLDLPAAWTGTAELTIEVHGRCADTGGTSFYTRPAQFALQVSLPPAAAGPSRATGSTSAGAPGSSTAGPSDSSAPVTDATTTPVPATAAPVSMTLGITPTDVPGLSIYSTSSSRDGSVRRTWAVDARADPAAADRTLISATLLDDQPVGGALPPNLLVDSETDLLPCESGTGVRLPRPLAKGATVTGWVSATQASLDVTATTTDGERSMQAHLDLARTPGP